MNSIDSTLKTTHNLKIKNCNPIEVGLDIGGSLTKMAVSIKKEYSEIIVKLKEEIEFLDEIQMEENIILIKLMQTINFSSEGRDFLKSKNIFI
jgi:tartrate dehydratase alpha subunit/fumarate hydratase class I-like protein